MSVTNTLFGIVGTSIQAALLQLCSMRDADSTLNGLHICAMGDTNSTSLGMFSASFEAAPLHICAMGDTNSTYLSLIGASLVTATC
jgi:hypothetical protein